MATRKENGEIMPMAVDPPMLSHYSTYSYPTSIKVKLNKTGNNAIVTVSMTSYMKNVLPNEWIPSWNTEALKAGAYCVKMVGIYRAISPMSSAGGYNLTQSTQMYKPNSSYASTSNAIDSISNSGMADSSGKLFFQGMWLVHPVVAEPKEAVFFSNMEHRNLLLRMDIVVAKF